MTLEIGLLLAILAGMVYLFLTEKLPVDLTAFLGLTVLLFAGYLTPSEAFSGFSSPAVITMLAIFIVSAGLLYTGVADAVAIRMHAVVGAREVPLIIALSLLVGVLSAFMNNIAATAVLMPAVASLAARAGIAPARLFMPLAFAAILGGTTTLVGTPPNILAADMLQQRGLEPFSFFAFTPIGLLLLGIGTLYMVLIGRRWLSSEAPAAAGTDLTQVYQVRDKLFTLAVPAGSGLDGRTLADSQLGSALGVKVVALQRGREPRIVPRADTLLEAGDRLLVQGRIDDARQLLEARDLAVAETRLEDLPLPAGGVGGVRARLPEASPLAGRTLRQLDFRRRFRLVVLAVSRDGELHREGLPDRRLAAGDELLAVGPRDAIEALASGGELTVEEAGFSALSALSHQLHTVTVPAGSPLAGHSLAERGVAEMIGLPVAAVVRGGEILVAPRPEEPLAVGDRLLVVAEPHRLDALRSLGAVSVETANRETLDGREIGLVEAAVAPRSGCVGRTLRELDFRERRGMVVLSIWRQGAPLHGDLADVPLALGDALLLQGRKKRIAQLVADPDFVVLTHVSETPLRRGRAPFAIAGLALMVGLVVPGWQPIHVAAFAAATLVLLSGAVKMQEAYRAIEWRAIFLVAAVLPAGIALENSGAANLLADNVVSLVGDYGPYALLAAFVLLASLLSQALDGAPAVVLLTPVVLRVADVTSISPYPLMMGIALAASAAFMTPFSHKANLLVMGAGGYRSMDYLKVGTPLTVVLLGLMVWLVPWFFSF
ncbi:MAG TPA: SLC13 family permease [Thermoanaerobaculia bacterium]|nr:SLC13 family permease [Thermoanaerobaculia bacterium]